jgi:zinc and cadmium transporter
MALAPNHLHALTSGTRLPIRVSTALVWTAICGIGVALVSLSGAVTLFLGEDRLKAVLLPLVAFSAGSLIGSALFNMLPAVEARMEHARTAHAWMAGGFVLFFAFEQLVHWHHSKQGSADHHHPMTLLVLLGDGLHKLVGGVAVGAAFSISPSVGLTTFIAEIAHEIPHELGDFGALVHCGLPPARALLWNFLSALPFLVGGIAATWIATTIHISLAPLLAVAAGNFFYLGSVDLLPELNRRSPIGARIGHVFCFLLGLCGIFALSLWLPDRQ